MPVSSGIQYWFRRFGPIVFVLILGIGAGLVLTQNGYVTWDDIFRYRYNNLLFDRFFAWNGNNLPQLQSTLYYGPLWEIILGISTRIPPFSFANDPYWIRHGLNVGLVITALYLLYRWIHQISGSKGTALLSTFGFIGIIRLGGHALFNVKDVPAAVAYTLVSIALWKGLYCYSTQKKYPLFIILLGLVFLSFIPFLVRPPLVLHCVVVCSFFATTIIAKRNISMLLWLCCTVAIAIALLWFVYPPLYFDGLNGLVDSYIRFTNYPLNIEERFFGWTYLSTNLPWYYSLLWIPLITDPLALFAAAIGLICLPCKQSQFGSSFRWLNVDWNLTRWLLLITSLSWLAVLILQPTLYDGERQLLWLYSLTLILALLGLHGLKERTKVCLSLILLISCSISYIQWHPYGYLYRSPLLLTTVDMFTGDYWRVCISEGLLKIPSQIAQGSTVVVDNSAQIEWMQRERLEKSILYTDSFLYKTVADIPNDTPFALLTFRSKRSRYWKKAEAYLKENKAQLVWRQALPTGEPICRLIWVKM